MKIVILLTTTLLCIQQGFTKDEISNLSYVSEKGDFKVNCQQDNFCTLIINGFDVSTQFPFEGQKEGFISEYTDNEKGLYLLNIYHGDGCPSMYRLLHLLKDKKHYISEPFGNCNEISDFRISLVNHEATIRFPAFKEASRVEISYKYSLAQHELKQEKTY